MSKKSKISGSEGVDLLDKQKEKLKPPSKYNVVFWNDDYTPMDFVIVVLMDVFRKPPGIAFQIMMDVHENGKGIAGGPYPKEIGETKIKKVIQYARTAGHPLKVTLEEN